jgi:uncharacterized protein YjbI with pentapeptide repeats
MNQIAVEASHYEGQKGYVEIIKNILCAIIRENSNIENDDSTGKSTTSISTPLIIFETIIEVLFIEKSRRIYTAYPSDLSNSVLKGCRFDKNSMPAHLERANLRGAHLENAYLYYAHLEEADLSNAYLEKAILMGANLDNAYLSGAHLEKTDLSGAYLEKVDFYDTFLDENTDFTGTIHECKSIDEIKAYKPPDK